jgi:hypothetical protein
MLKGITDKIPMLFNEGLVTTAVATLIVTESVGWDLAETLDRATFGGFRTVQDMIPRSTRGMLGTAAMVWAGAYLAGQVIEKGIPIPFTDIEIGGDLPLITSSEDSLF